MYQFPKGADREKAARAMAAVYLTLRGTPFIYEGQELGFANVAWPSIEDYNDISSKGQYQTAIDEGFTPEEALEFVHYFSRDNARTPMQWDASKNAGFTSGTPWLPVHDDYALVNAEVEGRDRDSVLSWYQKLAEFRKSHPELTEGSYELLLPQHEQIFAFSRKLEGSTITTVANFSLKPAVLPKELTEGQKLLLDSEKEGRAQELAPLEARIYRSEKGCP